MARVARATAANAASVRRADPWGAGSVIMVIRFSSGSSCLWGGSVTGPRAVATPSEKGGSTHPRLWPCCGGANVRRSARCYIRQLTEDLREGTLGGAAFSVRQAAPTPACAALP
ncbi:hypothetical protein Scani_24710 [Streptomyces caniferus]|uniref:Uncharacterized protein n=1 Tax=Streptomyces caniferus TaxID=285557 RepID=A0A640S3Z7_9ACTN|nr:hypothetical protein Scani_24710 [Streptomyces caniferus]